MGLRLELLGYVDVALTDVPVAFFFLKKHGFSRRDTWVNSKSNR